MDQVDVIYDVHVERVNQNRKAHHLVDKERNAGAKLSIKPTEIQKVRKIVTDSDNVLFFRPFSSHQYGLIIVVEVIEVLEELDDLGEANATKIDQAHPKRVSVVVGNHN